MSDKPRQPAPSSDLPEQQEPAASQRVCAYAIAALALTGIGALVELVMYPPVMAASIGHAVFWAGTFLSFALPTVGAVLAVVALSEIGNRQGKLGGKSLAVLTFYMAAAVGVGGAVSGRPVVMLSSFIAGASAVIAYVWIALTRAARSHSRRNPCR